MDEARAVVIGGGVGGASIAYHLTLLGWNEIVLVDRAELTSGSTFHSAGLVGQLRSSVTLTRMMMYSAELYRRLKDETGLDPGWHEVGSLRLASSTERMQELRRLAGWGKTFGLPLQIVSTQRALELFPLLEPEGVEGAAFLPTDGHLDPSSLTFALAEGAKSRGCRILTGTRVTGIDVSNGRVTGVRTDAGDIRTDVVVNAGGMYANQIGRLAGVEVPVVPFANQYLITKPIEGVRKDFPTMRDPDRLVYFREDVGGLVAGGYERNPAPWSVADGPPADFNNTLLPEDRERFEPLAEAAFGLVPALREAEVVKMINGPEAFRPMESSSSASRRSAGSSSRPASAPTASPELAASARSWPSGSCGAGPSTTSGRWTSAASAATTAAVGTRRPAPTRSTPPTTTSTTPVRNGRPGGRSRCRRPTRGWSRSARSSERSRGGSGPTGSAPTRTRVTRDCARAAGPASTGRRPSPPSTSRRASAPGSSTRPLSPRSRSRGPARSNSSSGCAPPTSAGRRER